MAESPSDVVRDIAAKLVALSEDTFTAAFRDAFRGLLSNFYVDSAAIRDSAGSQTAVFETVVSTEPIVGGIADASSAACAICVYHSLDEAKMRNGYYRIAQAKNLVKQPPIKEEQSTATLGVIVAAQSTMSLSQLADKVKELNVSVSDEQRPDMVTVLSRGVTNYGIRFSGDLAVMEYLPPQPGSRSFVAPTLLHIVTTATTAYSLNRTVGYIIGHLAFFAGDLPRPDMRAIIEGAPSQRNIIATYQRNLAGKQIEIAEPAPIERPPYIVEDQKGELLARLYYQPWQDGGVVLNEGRLPLEGLLPLMLLHAPMAFRPTPDRQLSTVLPLTLDDFRKAVERIPQRSNLRIRVQQQQFTAGKFMDEGTSTPFVARLWFTPLQLRDMAITDPDVKRQFDSIYQSVLNDLTTLRRIARETIQLWKDHVAKVASGQIARYDKVIHVDELINEPLNYNMKTIIKDAASAAKTFQELTAILGVDTGFMYQRPAQFEVVVEALEANDPALADYLREARKWMEPVTTLRNNLEHKPYVAPPVAYNRTAEGGVRALEPYVMGLPITQFIPVLLSRLNRYVEEVQTWCFQRFAALPIGEIPIAKRDPDKPERFKFIFSTQEQPWVIIYSDDDFDRV
jgi:hypothetical protein